MSWPAAVEMSLTAPLALGFVLGLRHALDADHIAAVSALVSEEGSLARSCALGTLWGAGHTAALLAAAVALLGFKLTITPALAHGFELAVAGLLIVLGGRVLLRCLTPGGAPRHRHPHAARPFLVGLLHGMAGSAALGLLAVTAMPSATGGIVYVAVFGAGATAGMLLVSGLIGLPFVLTARRSRAALVGVQAVAGAASLVLGCSIAWQLTLT